MDQHPFPLCLPHLEGALEYKHSSNSRSHSLASTYHTTNQIMPEETFQKWLGGCSDEECKRMMKNMFETTKGFEVELPGEVMTMWIIKKAKYAMLCTTHVRSAFFPCT